MWVPAQKAAQEGCAVEQDLEKPDAAEACVVSI